MGRRSRGIGNMFVACRGSYLGFCSCEYEGDMSCYVPGVKGRVGEDLG
jgi:hypothetical protein